MKKRKFLLGAGVAAFALMAFLLCAVLLSDEDMSAESRDGLWKGYIVEDTGAGRPANYKAYLYYLGNRDGDIGEIQVQRFPEGYALDGKDNITAAKVSLAYSRKAPRSSAYTLTELSCECVKKMNLGIVWKDSSGDSRYSCLIF